MKHTFSVIVRADVGEDEIRLVIHGCLTEVNASSLHAILRRALSLDPEAPVVVDLMATQHCEPAAVAQLERAVETSGPHRSAVRFLAPSPPPLCPKDAPAHSGDGAR